MVSSKTIEIFNGLMCKAKFKVKNFKHSIILKNWPSFRYRQRNKCHNLWLLSWSSFEKDKSIWFNVSGGWGRYPLPFHSKFLWGSMGAECNTPLLIWEWRTQDRDIAVQYKCARFWRQEMGDCLKRATSYESGSWRLQQRWDMSLMYIYKGTDTSESCSKVCLSEKIIWP